VTNIARDRACHNPLRWQGHAQMKSDLRRSGMLSRSSHGRRSRSTSRVAFGCSRIVVILRTPTDMLIAHVTRPIGEGAIAFQDPPQGTGPAVRCAETALGNGFVGDLGRPLW